MLDVTDVRIVLEVEFTKIYNENENWVTTSTFMVVALSVVVMAALSNTINISIFFFNISIDILPEQTHAASQEGEHAEKLHRALQASPPRLSRLHLQKDSPPRLYTHSCFQGQVADQVQSRRKSTCRWLLGLDAPFRDGG